MTLKWPAVLIAGVLTVSCTSEAMSDAPAEESIVFETASGESVDAYRGTFIVPENRHAAKSRDLHLHYIRFPATGEKVGAPIVYLAGGPGGSGISTAKYDRFALFMAMREFGDVIALDQRGTGESADAPGCRSSFSVPTDEIISEAEFVRLHREAAKECAAFWADNGIDILGYTTRESVQDLDALRRHLGAEKITLWGTSYGSHLALAAMKDIGPHIDKVVLSSAEGLDQTVKLPARTDAFFVRLQEAVNTDPVAAAAMPDIVTMIRGVHARLDADPVMLSIPQAEGDAAPMLLDKRGMQALSSAMIADPQYAVQLLWLYRAAADDDFTPLVQLLQRFFQPGEKISFQAMPLAMDMASGVSDKRLALIEAQVENSLVGGLLNFPMPQVRGAIPGLDLGDEFRTDPRSDIPTLLFTGTLDGRTYIDGQAEAVAGLSNLTQVMVINAGHNLFMSSPEVTEVIQMFMRGETVEKAEIVIPLPPLVPARP